MVPFVTEVRIHRPGEPEHGHPKLAAYASILLMEKFLVRDIKIIAARDGLLLQMPSRKLSDRCPQCTSKNGLTYRFCQNCGVALEDKRWTHDHEGRPKLSASTCNPVNRETREEIEKAVFEAYGRVACP